MVLVGIPFKIVVNLATPLSILFCVDSIDVPRGQDVLDQEVVELFDSLSCPHVSRENPLEEDQDGGQRKNEIGEIKGNRAQSVDAVPKNILR